MNRKKIVLIVILLLALGICIWNFPACYEVRDGDEIGYLSSGLLLWEGITPIFMMAPSDPLTWLGWSYSAALSMRYFFAPGEEGRGMPWVLRPFFAVDHALFDLYHDMSSLPQTAVMVIILVSLWGVLASFRLDFFRSGLSGASCAGASWHCFQYVLPFRVWPSLT